jgi:predicted lipoprotein with Yx(FWY)xxD motif
MVTFNGHPLYYFIKDSSAGDVVGQGYNNVWFVLDATGNAITSLVA